MTTPTNSDYIAAINVLRHGTPVPTGFVELYSEQVAADGFDAIVLGNTSTKQVIAAFLGPVPLFYPLGSTLSQGALTDDIAILDGAVPFAYVGDISQFAGQALQVVA